MYTSFSNILVPVDFSVNTDVAVQKAIWLASPGNAVMHLLHIANIPSRVSEFFTENFPLRYLSATNLLEQDNLSKLKRIKSAIQKEMPNFKVLIHLVPGGNIQKNIIHYANKIQPKLIIIGKKNNQGWIPFLKKVNANAISSLTNCPVLTVKPGSIPNKMGSIILPVGSFVPKRKIELLTALTRYHRPKIYLLAIEDNNTFNRKPAAFLDTYRALTELLHYTVEYEIISGKNAGKAILDYARLVSADIIMVDPTDESKMSTFSGAQINDLIPPASMISVLTARPYNQN